MKDPNVIVKDIYKSDSEAEKNSELAKIIAKLVKIMKENGRLT